MPIQPSFRDISVNLKDSYMLRIPVSNFSHSRIQTLYSRRNTFESRNCSRLNSLAYQLMSIRSFSSKTKKRFKFLGKSKDVCDDAAPGGKSIVDNHSALGEHHRSKKRDKSSVCNSINGQMNAAVLNSTPSEEKGIAKSSMPVNSTRKDTESKQNVVEDSLDIEFAAKSNDTVQDAKTPVRRNQKTRNKKQGGKKLVQDSTGNGAAKSNDKVEGAETPGKMNQKSGSNRQHQELSRSSAAAAETGSSNKTSEENTRSANGASHLTKRNSPEFSTGVPKIRKQIRPLYPPSGKSVVVVESVTKARVIRNYLGNMYEVIPSHGHLRDLAGRSGSVRPDDDFSMVWEVPTTAWTHLKSIKVALNG